MDDRGGTGQVKIGDEVELYSAFSQTWVGGFVVAQTADDRYVVRRVSDGQLLPPTSASDIRRAGSADTPPAGSGERRVLEMAAEPGCHDRLKGTLQSWGLGEEVSGAAAALVTEVVSSSAPPPGASEQCDLVLTVAEVGETICAELSQRPADPDGGRRRGVVVVDRVTGRYEVRTGAPQGVHR
ncbi:MAG TPA: hypothetical protein VFA11_01105 [Acidimicrobiales bacterium]|nr:hypothetical protein [Acidimicrobiales bacterium]